MRRAAFARVNVCGGGGGGVEERGGGLSVGGGGGGPCTLSGRRRDEL